MLQEAGKKKATKRTNKVQGTPNTAAAITRIRGKFAHFFPTFAVTAQQIKNRRKECFYPPFLPYASQRFGGTLTPVLPRGHVPSRRRSRSESVR
jgi:hypothetical protein